MKHLMVIALLAGALSASAQELKKTGKTVDELVLTPKDLHFDDCPTVKQVFGHTLQVEYDEIGHLVSGEPITTTTIKMLDTRCAYMIDTATFVHEAIGLK